MDPKVMYKMTYGLFLLTACEDGKDNGCIINTAIQVANEPMRIAISVINRNKTCGMVLNTGKFNISSITAEAKFDLFRRFGMQSGRDVDKFADFADVERSENGMLYLTAAANMYISAEVVSSIDLGSHTLFIAEVTDGAVLSNAQSCTYEYYQSDIKPKPQAVNAAKKTWVCSVCGYVYEGDEVPDDFECPLCHHGKEDFREVAAKNETQELLDGLRANFNGECGEAGMYLAMARVAYREGYPEIGKYWEKAALEEAEHAAKFEELLGELSADTVINLRVRMEAEAGACAGKKDLASVAKHHNHDAVHDTTHEMAKDEARHGKAFDGLLGRYFG